MAVRTMILELSNTLARCTQMRKTGRVSCGQNSELTVILTSLMAVCRQLKTSVAILSLSTRRLGAICQRMLRENGDTVLYGSVVGVRYLLSLLIDIRNLFIQLLGHVVLSDLGYSRLFICFQYLATVSFGSASKLTCGLPVVSGWSWDNSLRHQVLYLRENQFNKTVIVIFIANFKLRCVIPSNHVT